MDYNFDNFFSNASRLFGVLLIFFIILILIILVFCIFYILGRWKLFKKAGKNGWEAIIPFYNDWIYVEIAGLNSWWFFVVIATSVFSIISFSSDENLFNGFASSISLIGLFTCNYNISKKLNRDTTFAVLMTIFPLIMIPLIGLSKNYIWDDSVSVDKNGPFNSIKNTNYENNFVNNTNSKEHVYCTNCGAKLSKDSKFCADCGKEI